MSHKTDSDGTHCDEARMAAFLRAHRASPPPAPRAQADAIFDAIAVAGAGRKRLAGVRTVRAALFAGSAIAAVLAAAFALGLRMPSAGAREETVASEGFPIASDAARIDSPDSVAVSDFVSESDSDSESSFDLSTEEPVSLLVGEVYVSLAGLPGALPP